MKRMIACLIALLLAGILTVGCLAEGLDTGTEPVAELEGALWTKEMALLNAEAAEADNSDKPTKVKITQGSKATIRVGEKLKLKAKLSPSGAKSKLKWTSSNKKVATVSSSGVVKGIKKGTATITVKTANGKKAKCKITVKAIGSEIPFPIDFWTETHSTMTDFVLKKDWSFEGTYSDGEMIGPDEWDVDTYPFSGRFTSIVKMNDYCYKMKVGSFKMNYKWKITDVGHIWYLYKPGMPVSQLPSEVRSEFSFMDKTDRYAMYDATEGITYVHI